MIHIDEEIAYINHDNIKLMNGVSICQYPINKLDLSKFIRHNDYYINPRAICFIGKTTLKCSILFHRLLLNNFYRDVDHDELIYYKWISTYINHRYIYLIIFTDDRLYLIFKNTTINTCAIIYINALIIVKNCADFHVISNNDKTAFIACKKRVNIGTMPDNKFSCQIYNNKYLTYVNLFNQTEKNLEKVITLSRQWYAPFYAQHPPITRDTISTYLYCLRARGWRVPRGVRDIIINYVIT